MKKLLHSLVCGVNLVLIVASLSLHAEIEGTYVLDDSDESRFKWQQPELTFTLDEEGDYSATLTKGSGEVLLTTQDVEVDQHEFKAIFTMSSGLGEMEITFAGKVNDGKIKGTISESMFGSEVKLLAVVKTEDTTPNQETARSDQEDELTVSDSAAPQSINPKIVGTYVLDSKSNARRKPELTIDRDSDGEFSATLIAGKISETKDISGNANKFEATFTISTNMGDMDITYAGRVEQGKLSGTITESMFGSEVELVGILKKEGKFNQDD